MVKLFKKNLDEIQKINYEPSPLISHRIINDSDYYTILDLKTNYSLADDKKLYPSIFENVFKLNVITKKRNFSVKIKGRKNITKDMRYRWNNADIWGFLQIIALCSKDDRRVILASGIHDYLLEEKEFIYKSIKRKYKDFTIEEYRKLTSLIFEFILISQGMNPIKSKLMSQTVDSFQKHFQKKKWDIK